MNESRKRDRQLYDVFARILSLLVWIIVSLGLAHAADEIVPSGLSLLGGLALASLTLFARGSLGFIPLAPGLVILFLATSDTNVWDRRQDHDSGSEKED